MPDPVIQVQTPDLLRDFVDSGPLREALQAMAALSGCGLNLDGSKQPPNDALPICDAGQTFGGVCVQGSSEQQSAAAAMQAALTHAVSRELALEGVTEALLESFEELNLLYELLPSAATKTHANEISQWLVDEAAKLLRCERVALMMVDSTRTRLQLVASRGLPPNVQYSEVPIQGSVAGEVLEHDGLLICNSAAEFPHLNSPGEYQGEAFAIVRVPLVARGQALGVLTATERQEGEFTARDHKLLQSLSTVSASALLNCRLHATVTRQMISTIRALASAVDAKDHYTHDHSARVGHLSVATAREMNIRSPQELHLIELAGLLHDVGKIGVPDAILSKTGRLTPDEFKRVQQHAQIGARIVGHVDGLASVTSAVLHHHERFDGLGYPSGLRGDEIPLFARMIAVADVYDTLTSDRPYRKASSPEAALRELQACSGTHFDPEVVAAFERVIHSELEASRQAEAIPQGV